MKEASPWESTLETADRAGFDVYYGRGGAAGKGFRRPSQGSSPGSEGSSFPAASDVANSGHQISLLTLLCQPISCFL